MKTSRIRLASIAVLSVMAASASYGAAAAADQPAPATPPAVAGAAATPLALPPPGRRGGGGARNGETPQKRLEALEAVLQSAHDALDQAPQDAPDKFGQTTVAELERAQAYAGLAGEGFDGNPGSNHLSNPATPTTLPNIALPVDEAFLTDPKVLKTYPALAAVARALPAALNDFLIGSASVRQAGGGAPVFDPQDGSRDNIMQCVMQTEVDLLQGLYDFANGKTPPPASAASPLKRVGSITGVVVDASGAPVANAAIAIAANANADSNRIDPPILATLSNSNGTFTIINLQPGATYLLTASVLSAKDNSRLDGSVQPVEVKEGAQTKLPDPLQLHPGQ
jgi:hypothetical protein